MTIRGLSHITSDLERTAELLCEGLGAVEVYDSAGRNCSRSREKSLILAGVWVAAMEGGGERARTYDHIALHAGTLDRRLERYRRDDTGGM